MKWPSIKNRKIKTGILLAFALALVGIFLTFSFFPSKPETAYAPPGSKASKDTSSQVNAEKAATSSAALLVPPISDFASRITKKTFGLFVSPKNSPVSPERFTGFHTGTDFETFPDEQDKDVPISAVCSGKLLLKKWASGYGGVAVQACKINGQDVTVVYGHLRLSSISAKVGQQLNAGDRLGVLGKGYSSETDGERKHLHLSIHKGGQVNLLGYVQNKKDLGNWLDPQKLF